MLKYLFHYYPQGVTWWEQTMSDNFDRQIEDQNAERLILTQWNMNVEVDEIPHKISSIMLTILQAHHPIFIKILLRSRLTLVVDRKNTS